MAKRIYQLAPELKNPPWYLSKIGSVFRLSGIILQGEGERLFLHMPDCNYSVPVWDITPTVEEWSAILQQSDNPLIMVEGKKPWIRKTEYVISGFIQQKIWVRDKLQCVYCHRKMGEVQLTIDHFMPLELNGNNDPSNYITACRRDNKLKGSKHPKDFCNEQGYDYQYLVKYLQDQTR